MERSDSKSSLSDNSTNVLDLPSEKNVKPKRKSIVERELETNLTERVTSPITNSETKGPISRHGRARRRKADPNFRNIDGTTVNSLLSPTNDKTPTKSPVYKMHASNSPVKSEATVSSIPSTDSNDNDKHENKSNTSRKNLSPAVASDMIMSSPAKKLGKVYVRKDLIQNVGRDIEGVKNIFSPNKGKQSNSHLNNIFERSDKCNLYLSGDQQNGYLDTSSVVKTLDFDSGKKKKKDVMKVHISKNELFEIEAKSQYQVGDLAWARVGTYPFWPCIVTRDPYSGTFVKKKLLGRVEKDVIHVTFFGDNGRRGWIVINMLRNFLGLTEFTTAKLEFTPEQKKKDPKLYAAYFVSDKKVAVWKIAVDEAETLLREPKRLRIEILNDMLSKPTNHDITPKQSKSGRVKRTDSDVSLSESLYDTLFSEDDCKTDDVDKSRKKLRKNSLDVSEVVTACLDNMAAKTGISKIQKQSHMDIWLQKAKSKTPEKSSTKTHTIKNKLTETKSRSNSSKATSSKTSSSKNIENVCESTNSDDSLIKINPTFHMRECDYTKTNNFDAENSIKAEVDNSYTSLHNDIDSQLKVDKPVCRIGYMSSVNNITKQTSDTDMSVAKEETGEYNNINVTNKTGLSDPQNITFNKTFNIPQTSATEVDTPRKLRSSRYLKKSVSDDKVDEVEPSTLDSVVQSNNTMSQLQTHLILTERQENIEKHIQSKILIDQAVKNDTAHCNGLVESLEPVGTEDNKKMIDICKETEIVKESVDTTENHLVKSCCNGASHQNVECKEINLNKHLEAAEFCDGNLDKSFQEKSQLGFISPCATLSSADNKKSAETYENNKRLDQISSLSKKNVTEMKHNLSPSNFTNTIVETIQCDTVNIIPAVKQDCLIVGDNQISKPLLKLELGSVKGLIQNGLQNNKANGDVSQLVKQNDVMNGLLEKECEDDDIHLKHQKRLTKFDTDNIKGSSQSLFTSEINLALKNAEFLQYLNLQKDSMLDENPQTTQEDLVKYLYNTWVYEQTKKSDIVKTDDIAHTNLVKGTKKVKTPKTMKKMRKERPSLAKQSRLKLVTESIKSSELNESKIEWTNDKQDKSNCESPKAVMPQAPSLENYKTQQIDTAQKENSGEECELFKCLNIDKTIVIPSDNKVPALLRDRQTKGKLATNNINSNITKQEIEQNKSGSPHIFSLLHNEQSKKGSCEQVTSNNEIIQERMAEKDVKFSTDRQIDDSSYEIFRGEKVHNNICLEEENEQNNHETCACILKEDSKGNQNLETKIPKRENSEANSEAEFEDDEVKKPLQNEQPQQNQKLKRDADMNTNIKSNIPKSYKSTEDPEFIKYLELRQDSLIDENPELTEDNIVAYLHKTWIYEQNLKSDREKTDHIEQLNLVKGLGDEPMTQPRKIKKKKHDKVNHEVTEYIPKEKPKRKVSQAYYNEDDSDSEDNMQTMETSKTKFKHKKLPHVDVKSDSMPANEPKINETPSSNDETCEEIDLVDDRDEKIFEIIEFFFSELSKPKPNVFKGLSREKVCEVCEKTGNLIKCNGPCASMYHIDCVNKAVELTTAPGHIKGRKKKKPRGRKKNLDDSETKSDTQEPNMSVDNISKKPRGRKKNLDDSETKNDKQEPNMSVDNNISIDDLSESLVVDADNLEMQLEAKMKEVLETEKVNTYDSGSDEELDWHNTVAGQCEIIDVKLKVKNQSVEFKCNHCQIFDTPVCFVCKSDKSPKNGIDLRQRCQVAHCHKYYHLECLEHWPQTQFNSGEPSKSKKKISENFEAMSCPRHVCHTCVCDDPRGCKTRFSGDKLARCVRCPATYHSFTKCLPAGTTILSAAHIICPRHYQHRPGKVPCHVNTGWCFICALGGTLICCEYCPTSFHAECLNIKPPEGNYMCEDCETGRLPLYGEMVWVKLGHYRWWPGLILHPSEIPDNIMAVKHSQGEFVVRFFGQYDHYWVNRGRVFPFQEGDSGRLSSQKSKIDEAFSTAMEHAQRACAILKKASLNVSEDTDIASSLLPPHYVKLKVNKPCGALAGRKIDDVENSMTQCECDPNEEEPCGLLSNCLNRMLLAECGPICRAGDRCCNRSFEKRLYPKLVPYRTPHRGWGLKTLEDIKQGQFVIEYVGELIDEEEWRRRMNRMQEVRDENYYFLTLDKDRMIDAGPKGNLARFMNHCCEPNCETQKWTVLGDVRVGLFAIFDIPANSEVTFNYNLECAGIEKKRCMCGAKRCSGYIGAKPKQEEVQPKKAKTPTTTKRPYKKRKPTNASPTTPKTKIVKPRTTQRSKPKELTEIEKDLLIIKNATNGISSDSESNERLSIDKDEKNLKDPQKALKRKRVSFSTEEVIIYDSDMKSPSVKKVKKDIDNSASEVGD